jgi:unsaturated rhamnogalacturonyl hydrolase
MKILRNMQVLRAAIAALLLCWFAPINAADTKSTSILKDWPTEASPQAVGLKLAHNLLKREHFLYPSNNTVHYAEVVAWYGALDLADRLHDKELLAGLEQRLVPLMAVGHKRVPPANHVDFSVFGVVPLQLYIQTGDSRYRSMGLSFADAQWDRPIEGGLTNQTRYWVDDMYMITALQGAAYRATGDQKYIDRAAVEMVVYLKKLQQPNGLFHHAPDAPFFWGRGNGWYAAGMTELLKVLPAKHPQRKAIMEGYKKMMASLRKHQSNEGLWRQLVDRPESWVETSSSAMFTFAFVVGVQHDWLPADVYGPAARKAWLALVKYINENGDVREVCVGTGTKNDYHHYIDRPRAVGDLHGQAPLLWTAAALLNEPKVAK